MSKLFELYVLGLLKDRFGDTINYHFTRQYNELDYLLNDSEYKMVVDAKYKRVYENSYSMDDIRQLSGYSRLRKVVEELKMPKEQVVDCLIIYPQINGYKDFKNVNLKRVDIDQFIQFYKIGVELPQIKVKQP